VYTDVQPEHYVHPVTGEMVFPPEMTVEIIAPPAGALAATALRPYVSYRVEEEIETKLLVSRAPRISACNLRQKTPPQWPPVRCTPTLLYEMHYKERVQRQLERGEPVDVGDDSKSAK